MKVIKSGLAFSLAAFVVAAFVGCGDGVNGATGPQDCTEIGCGASLQIEFARASWPAGKVDIVVDADGTTTNCSVTLPFASCDNLVQCDNPNAGFVVETSGCALPAAQHSISGLMWSVNGPKQVTITVSEDGTMLGTKTFQLTYTMSRPNGDSCDPVCNQAPTQAPMQF
jgi:hypothetical protein